MPGHDLAAWSVAIPEAVLVQAVPAGVLNDLRVTSEALGHAVVPAVLVGRIDQHSGQPAPALQSSVYLFPGGREFLPGAFLAGPACREALAEHRLVRFGAGGSGFDPLAPVVWVTGVADLGDGTVPVLD